MADTKQTPGDTPEPEGTDPGTPEPDDAAVAVADTDEGTEAPAGGEASASEDAGDADPGDAAVADPEVAEDAADTSALPYPTRVGWVVAAFLFFWPLAIPALVLSMRTAEANGTGNVRRAKKSSVRALDFALGAVTLGVLGIVGLALGIAAAPTYASSLPPGFVSAVRSFVPPALAGPLGITLPDAGPALTAPTSSPTPDDPDATTDPYADPYPDDPADGSDLYPTPGAETDGGSVPTDGPVPTSDTAATAGAEIPDLKVGDCFDTAATSGQTTLYRIPVVPCTTAHGGEIYAETTAPDSLAGDRSTPTQQALWDAADAYCYPQFAEFVGLRWARSELLYWPIAPSEESWADGDRRILCVVESESPVTGTLQGAER